MAVEKVRERLLRTTAALERHGVPYAVIGGNAVAVWVARVDEDAVRNTVDVDLLLARADLGRAAAALAEVGFEHADVQGLPVFVETANPRIRRGVHIVCAGERIRPHELHTAPDLSDVARADDGFVVIGLLPLVQMKLTAFRDRDRTHLRDMLELEMIDAGMEAVLPPDLRERLQQLRSSPE